MSLSASSLPHLRLRRRLARRNGYLSLNWTTLRLFMIFVSLTWTSYIFWIQQFMDMEHRKTSVLTDSLQVFLADMPFLYSKTAVDAVFYHIVVPENEEENMYTSRVVLEQLEQVALASAKQVYYTTHGPQQHELIANEDFIPTACRRLGLECHNKGHVQEEMDSLQYVHDYCTTAMQDEYSDGRRMVSFIHSSPRVVHSELPVNRRLRRILTESTLSQECVIALQQDNQCNVCGLYFAVQHTLHYPGNMWSASCRYIQQLIPPINFAESMERVVGDVLVKRLRRDVMTNLYPDDKLGLGSPSISEHWIGSHHDLRPCDIGPDTTFDNYLKIDYFSEDLLWGQAPRKSAVDTLSSDTMETILSRTEYRLREYYLLPGYIIKWRTLYGRLPNPESFVWSVFPDGLFWKLASEKYGLSVVETVVGVPSMALSGQDVPGNLPDTSPLYAPSPANVTFDTQTNVNVFYDIYIPIDKAEREIPLELDSIAHQIRAMTEATKNLPVTLYYQTMGHEALIGLDLCANNPQLRCKLLHHYEERYQGDTLRQLSQFCRANPHARAAFVHNQIPEHLQQGRRARDLRVIRALTMGAVSNECFYPEEPTCNMCSLIFELQPNQGALGNMWTASCEYVNELLPPHVFQERMQQHIGQVLAMKLSRQLVVHDFQEKFEQLGLGSYSLSQWIGSSPALAPCDLTTKALSYWSGADRSTNEFKLVKAPHKHNGILEIDKALIEQSTDASFRIREYQYLAGRLLKWFTLYGKAPERQSFAWRAFPDSLLWRNATAVYGNQTVAAITKQFLS